METFIPFAPSPGAVAAPAAAPGGPSAPADAAGPSGDGSFLRILMNSGAGEAPGDGKPAASAPVVGREEDPAGDVVPEEAVLAGGMIEAALFVAEPPMFALPAPAAAGDEIPARLPASGSVDASSTIALPAGPQAVGAPDVEPVVASLPAPGVSPAAVDTPAEAAERTATGGKDASARLAAPAADPGTGVPARPAAPLAAPADAPAGPRVFDGSAVSVPELSDAGRAASGVSLRISAEPAPAAASGASSASAAAVAEPPAASLEPALDGSEEGAAPPRVSPAVGAVRGTEPSPAFAAGDGDPSFASKEEDSGDFQSAMARARESEGVFHPRETAEPPAPQFAAAPRAAAEAAPAPRPAVPWQAVARTPVTFQAGENAFVLTRKSDTSLEVTLSPPGVGRLEIEVVLDRGVINANITAADPAGRDAIERSLPQIVQALADEGMAVGGFTVSLKHGGAQDGNAQAGNAQADGAPGNASGGAPVSGAARTAAPAGLVDIFV